MSAFTTPGPAGAAGAPGPAGPPGPVVPPTAGPFTWTGGGLTGLGDTNVWVPLYEAGALTLTLAAGGLTIAGINYAGTRYGFGGLITRGVIYPSAAGDIDVVATWDQYTGASDLIVGNQWRTFVGFVPSGLGTIADIVQGNFFGERHTVNHDVHDYGYVASNMLYGVAQLGNNLVAPLINATFTSRFRLNFQADAGAIITLVGANADVNVNAGFFVDNIAINVANTRRFQAYPYGAKLICGVFQNRPTTIGTVRLASVTLTSGTYYPW